MKRWGPVGIRVVAACVVVAAICLTQLSTTGADTAFNPGTASSGSQGIEIEPTTGSLSYAPILANSDADYENAESQALAETFDPGALIIALQGPSCLTGQPSAVPQSDDPQPIEAESTNGNQTQNLSVADSLDGSGAGVGVENASATQQPDGTASNTLASDDLAGLVDVEGVTTSANAQVANGDERIATATADMASVSLGGGAVVLGDLQWVATQTSGATSSSTATFTIGSLTVAGAPVPVPVPVSSLPISTVTAIINTALSPIGLQIDWPQEVTQTDGTVVITPLTVGVDDSALGQEIIGQNITAGESLRDELQAELYDINCYSADAFTVFDVGVGIAAGGGDLNFSLGGAHAVTNDVSYVDPFSTSTPTGSLPTASSGIDTSPVLDTLPPAVDTTIPGLPSIPATSTSSSSAAAPSTGTGGRGTVALGPTVRTASCRSTGPAGGGCIGSNLALPVGLIAFGLLGTLAVGDYLRQRRRRRLSGMETG